MTSVVDSQSATVVEAPEDLDDFQEWARANGWSDGMAVIPPTPERVERMLAGSDYDRTTSLGPVPPRMALATVEAVAANAVMAGCKPTAMPVLIAATQAMLVPEVNAWGAQATTHPCALMLMVSGPVAKHAEIHSGAGMFGASLPGNVSIGRAMRLIQQNIGGAYPGDIDRATQGTPAKISFCFAENEERNPWASYRVSQGFDEADSVVTVFFAEGPHSINDHVSKQPRGLALIFADTVMSLGKNNTYVRNNDYMIVLCPEHAAIFAEAGWDRSDVQEYLHERARIPYGVWKLGGMPGVNPMPKYYEAADDDLMLRITDRKEDVHVVVSGGPGLHSAFIPSFGLTRMTSRAVKDSSGKPTRFP